MLTRLILVLVAVWAAALATVSAAVADDEPPPDCASNGGLSYGCTEVTPGSPGEPGDPGGPAEPTCALVAPYTWCKGDVPCRTEEGHPPLIGPEGKKKGPDSKWMFDTCADGTFRSYYSDPGEPQEPPLAAQAETAIGQLDLGVPGLETSPSNRTIVRVPTWFWIDGAAPEQTGSSAFGLVAIATVKSLSVDTGDGTTLQCPWTTSSVQAEQQCTHDYTHTSHDGTVTWEGKPAYEVSATTTWELRFEIDGTPVTIPEAPTTIDGPASTAVLRVDEVQTTVENVG